MTNKKYLPINAEKKKIALCAKWLKYCLEIGFDKSQLDGLQKLWMDNHDYTGKFVPKVENSAQVESQANAFEDLRKLLWQAENARPEELHGRIEYIKSQFSVTRKGEAKQ